MAASDYEDASDYEYLSANGTSTMDFVVLGYRTPSGFPFSPFELESWIFHFTPEKLPDGSFFVSILTGTEGWFTGLWRSPAGRLYVSEMDGILHHWRDLNDRRAEAREETELPAQLAGVWGLSDDCVFTWGKAEKQDRLFRYDGRTWSPMPSPGHISLLRGTSPDHLYAVGYHGLISRWDNHQWTPMKPQVDSHFTGLFVAGPNELYATTETGELWEGSLHGWAKRAEADGPLLDVAKFKGEVWVAGGDEGLLKLKGSTNELECIKPNILAKSFDTRGNLLITAKDLVAQTEDGLTFKARGRDVLRQHREKERPMWLPDEE